MVLASSREESKFVSSYNSKIKVIGKPEVWKAFRAIGIIRILIKPRPKK